MRRDEFGFDPEHHAWVQRRIAAIMSVPPPTTTDDMPADREVGEEDDRQEDD